MQNGERGMGNEKRGGLYVHVPFCQRKCPYCGFYSVPVTNQDVNRVLWAMVREMDLYGVRQKIFSTVYVGGGSPSCLADGALEGLIESIGDRVGEVEEFTVEVNPGQITAERLKYLRKLGVNRLSVGAQSFWVEELLFLGRRYEPAAIEQTVQAAREAGFSNVNLDLIFAIPGSSLSCWRTNLERAIALGLDHISAYSLTYETGTPLYARKQADQIAVVDEDLDRAMYELTMDVLEEAGLKQYEISNFARPGRVCRHNLHYWANRPWLGIGPAAGSWWNGERFTNVEHVDEYAARVEAGRSPVGESEKPDAEQIARETAVLNLRRTAGMDLAEFHEQTGFEAETLFAAAMTENLEKGLLAVKNGRMFLTRQARGIADSVLCDFV